MYARLSLSRLTAARSRGFAASAVISTLNADVLSKAEQISSSWKGTSATGGNVRNFIGGKFLDSKASEWFDVLDPVRLMVVHHGHHTDHPQSTQTLLCRVPQTTSAEFDQAVDAASDAFKVWNRTSVLSRQRFAIE
jgi:malonate-semialdehyde dehydrogenase (acetylating)/methylmalonate-semialdehyde dehydrogenase